MNKKKALSIVLAVVLALSVYSEVAVAQFGGGGAFGDCANYLKVLGTSIIPNKTATYNLGSASKTFNTIYAGTMSVSNYVIATGGYVGLGAAKGRIVFTDAATDTINLTGGTTQIDELEITNGNITYVPISGDISTYITAATAGDTLVLAAGTYTITSGITVNKKLHIMGQGEGITTIYATGASADFTMISIASSGSRMSNMTIKNDGAVTLTTKGMVEVNSNCDISNIDFLNAATGVGSVKYYSIIFSGAFTGNIENCTGTASGDIGIHAFVYMHVSGATANIRNCKASGSAGDASGLGNIVLFIGSPGGTVNVYNSIFSDSSNNTGAVVYQTTSGGVTNIYNSTINGSGTGAFDVFQSAGTITLYNTTLVNNTTSGDVIQKGTIRTDGVTQRTNSATATVAPTLTQSKSSSATIDQIVVDGEDCGKYAANGCAASGSYQPLGYILWEVDGTPGAGTDMPGRMSIWTSPDGTATPTEKFRISSTGAITMLATGTLQIPNAADPTVAAVGQISVDSSAGAGSMLRFYGAAASALPAYQQKSFVINNPSSTVASSVAVWRVPYAVTVKAIHVLCVGGTSVVGQLWNYDANGLNGAVIDSADITATAGTNANDDGTLSAPAVAAANYIGWKMTTITGAPTQVYITFEYTVDSVA